MREAVFIKKNTPRWRQFEELLASRNRDNPDQLAGLFVQLTDDLSYARTHYPDSQTTAYLNTLAAKVHQSIYRNRKEERGRFVHFWRYELPTLFYSAHRQLLYSAILFGLAVLIGAVSTAHDERFPRLILGDSYVNMTLENIRNGDPMGVYKSQGQFDMFGLITFNNVMVSFWTFVMGIFFSFGTAYLLLRNGIMLGAFQYFFHTKGLLYTSALSIWIHGTLEISAIIIAGCAGLVMGNSLLFPGTYSRVESLKHGAVKGLKIIIGLVPIFIVAGFLESYVTRLTAWPDWAKLLVIGSSAAFIIWYFIIYPILLHRHADPSGQD
jgi:uncharacterized membrane protein SpoIIM required for sporulation